MGRSGTPTRTWLDALRGHGVPIDLVRSEVGIGGDKMLMDVARIDHESTEGRIITERRTAVFKGHYRTDLGPTPGARALVERLRSRGLQCRVVTSAAGSELADLLREGVVANLFDHMITSDDAEGSKPDPDLVKAALERSSVSGRARP